MAWDHKVKTPDRCAERPKVRYTDGYVQFFSRADVDRLYAGFTDHWVERSSYTMGSQQHLIELWIVACRKPGT